MASTCFLVLIALCSLIYFNDGVKANCGGLIEEAYGTITSPGYPGNYPPNKNCLWEIKMPPNMKIWFHFRQFRLEKEPSCKYDHVTVKSKREDGTIREYGRFCGFDISNFDISDGNILLINFKSDPRIENTGFTMDFFRVPFECNILFEERVGIITSPGFPLPYPPNLNCTWSIQAPVNHFIKLKFTHFETEESSECVQEYVTVQSKMLDQEIRGHGKYCGTKTPPAIISESNTLLINFKSHSNKGYLGFNASFISDSEICGGLIDRGKGNISSPFFPDLYPPNTMCEWNFLVPPQHKIKLSFRHFEIEEGDGCSNDFLQIQSNSTDGKIHEYGKYCGDSRPSPITSKDGITLKFVSDRSIERKGFVVEYFIDKLTDFESSVSSEKSTTPIYKATTTPVYEANTIPVENQYDDITKDLSKSRREENTISALMLLTKKVADMEERQIMLFSHYENMFNKLSGSSKDASLEDKKVSS